jgi:amino acid permease
MKNEIHHSGPAGAVYGLGFIGAAIYFIAKATGFWMGVLGFLKAIVWPAFLVYGALKSLGM